MVFLQRDCTQRNIRFVFVPGGPKRPHPITRNQIITPPTIHLGFFAPLIFLADLGFFLGREVVGDVERGTNFLGRLALDHGCDRGAGQVQERLNVHVICGENELKQQDLFKVNKVRVPLLDDFGHVLAFERLFNLRHGILQVVGAELDDLLQDLALDIGQGDLNIGSLVLGVLCL